MNKEDYHKLEEYVNYSLIKRVSTSGNLAFLSSEEPSDKLQKTFDAGHILERYFLENKDLSYIKIDKTKDLTGQSVILKDALLRYCREEEIKNVSLIPDELILELIQDLSLWGSTKKKDILIENSQPALKKVNFLLSLQENDVVASPDIFDIIKRAEDGLKDYPEVYETLYPSGDVEILTQYPIVLEEGFSLPVKGLLDRVHIDHTNRMVTIIDFKTMEERVEKFIYSSFYQHKYYYQLPFYALLFDQFRSDLREYKLQMKFVVISKSVPEISAVYILPINWVDKVWNGWNTKTGIKIRGIHDIMDEIKWYRELGGYSRSYYLAQNNNIVTIEPDWYE